MSDVEQKNQATNSDAGPGYQGQGQGVLGTPPPVALPPRTSQCYLDGLRDATKLVYDARTSAMGAVARATLDNVLVGLKDKRAGAEAMGVENTIFMLNETRLALDETERRLASWQEAHAALRSVADKQRTMIERASTIIAWVGLLGLCFLGSTIFLALKLKGVL